MKPLLSTSSLLNSFRISFSPCHEQLNVRRGEMPAQDPPEEIYFKLSGVGGGPVIITQDVQGEGACEALPQTDNEYDLVFL